MKIPSTLRDEIVAHALAEAPNECCGMVGSSDGEARRVYPATNIHASPLRYEIEAAGLELGAIYHSHTRSEPYPSQTDINIAVPPELCQPLWPGTIYLIVGLAGAQPALRAFRIDAHGVAELDLTIA